MTSASIHVMTPGGRTLGHVKLQDPAPYSRQHPLYQVATELEQSIINAFILSRLALICNRTCYIRAPLIGSRQHCLWPAQSLSPPISFHLSTTMLTTFTAFSKLPKEVQILIWKCAILERPRIIEVNYRSSAYSFSTGPSIFLNVCQASRTAQSLVDKTAVVTSRLTREGISTPALARLGSGPPPRKTETSVAFDFDKDILYFPYGSSCSTSYGESLGSFLKGLGETSKRKLRHLALTTYIQPESGEPNVDFLRDVLRVSKRIYRLEASLTDLTLIVGDPYMMIIGQTSNPTIMSSVDYFENIDAPTTQTLAQGLIGLDAQSAGHTVHWGAMQRHQDFQSKTQAEAARKQLQWEQKQDHVRPMNDWLSDSEEQMSESLF